MPSSGNMIPSDLIMVMPRRQHHLAPGCRSVWSGSPRSGRSAISPHRGQDLCIHRSDSHSMEVPYPKVGKTPLTLEQSGGIWPCGAPGCRSVWSGSPRSGRSAAGTRAGSVHTPHPCGRQAAAPLHIRPARIRTAGSLHQALIGLLSHPRKSTLPLGPEASFVPLDIDRITRPGYAYIARLHYVIRYAQFRVCSTLSFAPRCHLTWSLTTAAKGSCSKTLSPAL
jgi:hypothetical protein